MYLTLRKKIVKCRNGRNIRKYKFKIIVKDKIMEVKALSLLLLPPFPVENQKKIYFTLLEQKQE